MVTEVWKQGYKNRAWLENKKYGHDGLIFPPFYYHMTTNNFRRRIYTIDINNWIYKFLMKSSVDKLSH